jgi:hypothetical protein
MSLSLRMLGRDYREVWSGGHVHCATTPAGARPMLAEPVPRTPEPDLRPTLDPANSRS